MSKLKARVVLKDKFWIIEHNGIKTASLQQTDDGFSLMGTAKGKPKKEHFSTLKELSDKYNISFNEPKQISTDNKDHEIYGFKCKTKPYNDMYDVKRKIPVYTKNEKSKSFYCAGYYGIKFDNWMASYCPKLLTLTRYNFIGPFKTELEMKSILKKYNE